MLSISLSSMFHLSTCPLLCAHLLYCHLSHAARVWLAFLHPLPAALLQSPVLPMLSHWVRRRTSTLPSSHSSCVQVPCDKARQLAEWQLQPGLDPNSFLLGKGMHRVNPNPALDLGGKLALQCPVCRDGREGSIVLKRKLIMITALPEFKSVTLEQMKQEENKVFTSYGHDNHPGYFGVLF